MISQISMLRVQSSAWRLPSVAFSEERGHKINWLEYLFNYWSNSTIKMCQLKNPPRNIHKRQFFKKAFDVLCVYSQTFVAVVIPTVPVVGVMQLCTQPQRLFSTSIHPPIQPCFGHIKEMTRSKVGEAPAHSTLGFLHPPKPHSSCLPILTSSRITVSQEGSGLKTSKGAFPKWGVNN